MNHLYGCVCFRAGNSYKFSTSSFIELFIFVFIARIDITTHIKAYDTITEAQKYCRVNYQQWTVLIQVLMLLSHVGMTAESI